MNHFTVHLRADPQQSGTYMQALCGDADVVDHYARRVTMLHYYTGIQTFLSYGEPDYQAGYTGQGPRYACCTACKNHPSMPLLLLGNTEL